MTCVECAKKQLYINQLKMAIEDFYEAYTTWNTTDVVKNAINNMVEVARLSKEQRTEPK